mmetsp:Transcript_54922/g.157959  ORF Transcript_54922/g.157959 Transcript_54922/m.157959 type:complete len:263 (+) Transcript_54922:404-1192(+)|eukprot:CAMPEP_0177194562 /NCGR_PEP_ID=MMETSP0367-20130122/23039_1 /TAXON_ID=447022 ORGANISM="Scrippsiella hangoei-like, Strain SHHI-4" /NCGR_SAMPLE_ID=MMETSP0367 /ASSEMBLY_ACC=CAM_ASM_000362 /LENGTH=262 /DNA_ID=CAMNT_0018642517 /DNA_START=354 /DNA_END=1142 /DNA_ORIENTATION=+
MRTPLLTSEDVKDGALNSRLEANEMGVRRLAWISARMRLASKDGSRTTGHAGRCSMHAPTLRRSAEAAATAARATRLRWLPWCRLGRREPATFRAAAQRKRGVAAQPLAGTSFDSCVGAVATSASTASDGTSKASSRSISECTTTGCNAATGTFTSTVGATTSKSCAAGEVFHGMAATRTAIRAERADFEARAPATVRAAAAQPRRSAAKAELPIMLAFEMPLLNGVAICGGTVAECCSVVGVLLGGAAGETEATNAPDPAP